MEKEIIESKVLIATRRPLKGTNGDNWVLKSSLTVYNSLTEALEAYFQNTGFNKAFYLDPIGGNLYSVNIEEVEVHPPSPPKEYSIYGTFKQGI